MFRLCYDEFKFILIFILIFIYKPPILLKKKTKLK